MKPSRPPTHKALNRHVITDTGGIKATAAQMLPPVREPCPECPLRRDSTPGYLGGYSPEMYIEAMRGPASLACHSSKGFKRGDVATQRHCTGVAGFRANVGIVAAINGSATRAHDATEAIGPDRERYFASEAEFIAHHKPGQS